jgi:D-aspartate ligase
MTARLHATERQHDPVELGLDGDSVPVLVLRRSLSDLQHCVLAVGRTLGRLGVPVYAIRRSRTEPATMSRYIRGDLDLRVDATEEEWVDQLMGLEPHLSGGILLPIDDVSAVTVGSHREVLSRRFRLPEQPLDVPRRLASKLEMARVCRELDVPTPETTLLSSPEEAVGFAERFGFPVVLKRSVAWGGTEDPQAPSVLIVHGPTELRQAYDRIRNQSPDVPNVIAQEYIPGGSESVWMFNGYFDRESRCLSAFTGQKIRQCAHGAGQTTLGICAHNETVVGLATRLLEGVQYRGIVDMGFRFDARDGRYKLLDVNPRVGSTFRLFSDADGGDVVRAMYLDLTGRPVPAAAAVPGRTWRDEPRDALAALRLVRTRELSLGAWARSVGRTSESAWWAKDDPVPFFAMAASLPRQAFTFWPSKRRSR